MSQERRIRRSLTACLCGVLFALVSLPEPAAAQSRCRGARGNPVAHSSDLSNLIQGLLQRHGPDTASQPIRMVDESSKRKGYLYITTEPGDDHYLAILRLSPLSGSEQLYVHTVRVALDEGEWVSWPILKWDHNTEHKDETIVTHLRPVDLERLARIDELELRLQGFDTSFEARIGPRGVAKIRRFQERQAATTPGP